MDFRVEFMFVIVKVIFVSKLPYSDLLFPSMYKTTLVSREKWTANLNFKFMEDETNTREV